MTLDSYADPTGTARRMTLLSEAAFELAQNGIELFSLPGGYLFASSDGNDLQALQKQAGRLAIDCGIDLLVGVDEIVKDTHPDAELIRRSKLGAFAIFASRHGAVANWRQRTITGADQHLISDTVCTGRPGRIFSS
ncbi:MAG: hypothetical protein DMG09_05105 [Acidobacteria bacterium]|nr:MAG: hypothetical protein DMG09_05105 [Acidobacteriota bacterium]